MQVSRESPSILSLLSVWRSIYQTSNRVSLSSKDAKRIIFEGTGNGCERGRLQKVVDKGLRLICLDAQAIYAITIGTEGIKHTKLDKLPIGQNRRRYRVSYTLLLKLSLSSPFFICKGSYRQQQPFLL